MITNPLTLLPLTALTIFGTFLSDTIFGINDRLISDLILNYEIFEESNLLFILITQYPIEIILNIIIAIIGLTIALIAVFSIVKSAKKSIIDAIDESIKNWKKAITLAFYAGLVFFLWIVGMFAIINILQFIETIIPLNGILMLIVFPIILFGGLALILTKTIFVIVTILETNLKRAIQESWSFTNKKFWNAFFFIIILMIITAIIGIIGEIIGFIITQNIGTSFEIIINYATEIIASTFFILAITYYYYAY